MFTYFVIVFLCDHLVWSNPALAELTSCLDDQTPRESFIMEIV